MPYEVDPITYQPVQTVAPEPNHNTMYVCATVVILAGGAIAWRAGAPPLLIFLIGAGLFVALCIAVNCFSHRTVRTNQPPEWERVGTAYYPPVRERGEGRREPVDLVAFREAPPAANGSRRFIVHQGGRADE